jgi:inositol oxygenase
MKNLKVNFNHDEYMYQMLSHNKAMGAVSIPDIGLQIIRYHSLYPWHEKGEYRQFMTTGKLSVSVSVSV